MSKREWREAEELASRGRWQEAGERYAALVERSARVKDTAAVRKAASLAADAFRRDDRPAAAARMLMAARAAGKDDPTDAAQLAAVLLDAGQVEAGADIVGEAARKAADPVAETVALDTEVGLLLTLGRVEEARARADRLETLGLPGAAIALRFRRAQLDRLDGVLRSAEERWIALERELSAWPQAAGPRGAALAELGELELLRASVAADPGPGCERAIAHFDASGQAWAQAGRRAGALRAEAWAARARAVAGETVVAPGIDRAVEYADDRGLHLLAADLRVCRAVVRHDADEVLHALDRLAEAPLARGRARVVRAELGGVSDLDLALTELRSDGPWTARALFALGRARGDQALLAEAAARVEGW